MIPNIPSAECIKLLNELYKTNINFCSIDLKCNYLPENLDLQKITKIKIIYDDVIFNSLHNEINIINNLKYLNISFISSKKIKCDLNNLNNFKSLEELYLSYGNIYDCKKIKLTIKTLKYLKLFRCHKITLDSQLNNLKTLYLASSNVNIEEDCSMNLEELYLYNPTIINFSENNFLNLKFFETDCITNLIKLNIENNNKLQVLVLDLFCGDIISEETIQKILSIKTLKKLKFKCLWENLSNNEEQNMSITSLSIFFSDKGEICIFNLLNIFPNLENL